jgi:hypothetical protein
VACPVSFNKSLNHFYCDFVSFNHLIILWLIHLPQRCSSTRSMNKSANHQFRLQPIAHSLHVRISVSITSGSERISLSYFVIPQQVTSAVVPFPQTGKCCRNFHGTTYEYPDIRGSSYLTNNNFHMQDLMFSRR